MKRTVKHLIMIVGIVAAFIVLTPTLYLVTLALDLPIDELRAEVANARLIFENVPEYVVATLEVAEGNKWSSNSNRRWGTSSIGAQVARITLQSNERAFIRGLRQLMLTKRLEWEFGELDLAVLYASRAYFGCGTYGLSRASHEYFGKAPEQLQLGEAAYLAATLRRPSDLSPCGDPAAWRERQQWIISEMRRFELVSAAEAQAAERVTAPSLKQR